MVTTAFFRKRKILASPIGGAEYSSAIYAAVLLLGILIIAAGSTEFLFKSYKALSGRDDSFSSVLLSFSKFFGVTVASTVLYLGISIILTDIISGGKGQDELRSGNIPLGIIGAAIALGTAILIYAITQPIFEWLTPVVLNFR
jgi:hypothetical protein